MVRDSSRLPSENEPSRVLVFLAGRCDLNTMRFDEAKKDWAAAMAPAQLPSLPPHVHWLPSIDALVAAEEPPRWGRRGGATRRAAHPEWAQTDGGVARRARRLDRC